MFNILITNPFSIQKIANDISKVLNAKIIKGFYHSHKLKDNVIIIGNPDTHLRQLYDSVKDNQNIKNIIIYTVCEGILDIRQTSWLRHVKAYIITPSKYVKQKLECAGINVDDVIPHGVSQYGKIKEKKNNILGYISGYQKRKYPDYLYPKFFNYIKNLDFRIITTGNNPYIKYFKHVDTRAYSYDNGYVNSFYDTISFYVNLSDSEGFGLTVLEALAHGNVIVLPALPVFTEMYPSDLVFYVKLTGKKYYESYSFEDVEHFEYDVDDMISKINTVLGLSDDKYKVLSERGIVFSKDYDIYRVYERFKGFV